jgi:NitT/TauT family transport system permease protein
MIIALGIGFATIVTIVFFMTVFMIIINTALGVRLVSQVLTRTAVSFGATRRETILKVVFPAALPAIVAGLQLGVGRALTGTVVAEIFIGSSGIGYSIGYYAGTLRLADVYLGILILGVLGVSLHAAVNVLERRVNFEADEARGTSS